MATINDFRNALVTWINTITSRPVILSDAYAGPNPKDPFAVILVESSAPRTAWKSEFDVNTEIETISRHVNFIVTIDMFGGDPFFHALQLEASLYSANKYIELPQDIVGLNGSLGVQDLSSLEVGNMRTRAQLRIEMNANITFNFTTDVIEEYDIELQIPEKNYTDNINVGN